MKIMHPTSNFIWKRLEPAKPASKPVPKHFRNLIGSGCPLLKRGTASNFQKCRRATYATIQRAGARTVQLAQTAHSCARGREEPRQQARVLPCPPAPSTRPPNPATATESQPAGLLS